MLRRMRLTAPRRWWWLVLGVALVVTACGSEAPVPGAPQQQSITLYTCANDTTVQPVITAFQSAHPGSEVKLFRAPTGELNARVASDVRSGGLKADVVWACDPLTMHGYLDQQLVGGWLPQEAADIPEQFRTADSVGVAVLYLVAVHAKSVAPPTAWSDLTGSEYAPVAIPDPGVAASALGALGYFSQAEGYGLDFYRKLQQQGAKQVGTPDNVTTGVAQGQYRAGITIANSAYLAREKGSPIEVTWPKPGAVEIYGPIALARHSADSALAKDFMSYVVSQDGQQVMADAGSYPTRPGVSGPEIPTGAPVVYPDWEQIASTKDKLLKDYQTIFGH
jgi:iron(III) transport system substrate-binding protein